MSSIYNFFFKLDIGLENLVNVLHHFAFGDSKSVDYNFKIDSEGSSNCNNSLDIDGNSLKKFKNIDDTGSVSCHILDINSGFRDLIIDKKVANQQQDQTNEINDQPCFEASSVIVEELCNCENHTSNQRKESSPSLLHLSLSYGKGKSCAHTDYKLKQELLNDVNNYFEEEDEDEQIKRKENLLQELLKIEKQLDSQKNKVPRNSTVKSTKHEEINVSNNYDHISMINKYLIKKCQYDLNRLYKIKLRQLQQKPIGIDKYLNEKQNVDTEIAKIMPATVNSLQSNVSDFKNFLMYESLLINLFSQISCRTAQQLLKVLKSVLFLHHPHLLILLRLLQIFNKKCKNRLTLNSFCQKSSTVIHSKKTTPHNSNNIHLTYHQI